jgi:hypothetical protein
MVMIGYGTIKDKPHKATDPALLDNRLMSPLVPKTELEWYAMHKIEKLRKRVEELENEDSDYMLQTKEEYNKANPTKAIE